MDEKTAELRDIFIETTGSDTVTERQSDRRGSLADVEDPEAVRARVAELVGQMRERFEFRTDLADDQLVSLVVGYYHGDSDEELATDLDIGPDEIRSARFDLHLVRDADRDTPFDYDRLEKLVANDRSDEEIADELDTEVDVVRLFRPVAAADLRSTRVNHRFRDDFSDLLTDEALSENLTEETRKTGLREATEDIETDVSF
ncbi:conditioned medium-induced protein 4 [Haloferax namakaokahaiae]|uniref:Conditioned medium-induced protein 4 n=1 Tax=Haloferax namakaokahaiae TaxID=1748331 RepID=A0ABD5ZHX2_9EURY